MRINNQRKAYELLLKQEGVVRALDIGCGPKKFGPAIGVDIKKHDGIDVVADMIRSPFPFKAGSFDLVVANHFIEHVDDVCSLMMQIHRVLRPGGLAVIRTPYFASPGSFQDPTHKWHLTMKSMDYFVEDSPLCLSGLPGYFRKVYSGLEFGTGPFQFIGRALCGLSKGYYEDNFSQIFPARVLVSTLMAVK
ncbi:MAG: class I SAM-dependent methyltransferase [Nitrospirota bacterium]